MGKALSGKLSCMGTGLVIVPFNIYCDPLLESSRRDSSSEGSQCMFAMRNKKNLYLNCPWGPCLSEALLVYSVNC